MKFKIKLNASISLKKNKKDLRFVCNGSEGQKFYLNSSLDVAKLIYAEKGYKNITQEKFEKYTDIILVDKSFNCLAMFCFNKTFSELYFTYLFVEEKNIVWDSVKLLYAKFKFGDVQDSLKDIDMFMYDTLYTIEELIDRARKKNKSTKDYRVH